MKPVLILGLGNPLMGDDGIGPRVAKALAADPRLPPDAEAFGAGTDLLQWADEMIGRREVNLIDAMLGDQPPGTVEIFEDRFEDLSTRQWTAHHLSTPQEIQLIRTGLPELRDVAFRLFAVTIESAKGEAGLSPALAACVPLIVDRVLEALERTPD